MNVASLSNPWEHLRQIAFDETVPIGMHVDLTYRCDLACVHCYLADRQRGELTLDEYRAFFSELADLGGFYLLVSGGDIFVRKDALDILWAAATHRFDMTLITHAMSIDDVLADQLKEMGIRRVSVSVYHTDPDIHDRVTRRSGSHVRTLAGIDRLLKRGVEVMIKTPVFKENEGAELVMPAFTRERGAIMDLGANIRAGNDGSTELLALNANLDEKANIYGCIFAGQLELTDLAANSPDDRTCNAAHASAYLGPDGTVQPCLDYEESAGNIREQRFSEIWLHSPLLNRLRAIRRRDFADCTSCSNVASCGLCSALSARETGDPTGRSPSKCDETKAILKALT